MTTDSVDIYCQLLEQKGETMAVDQATIMSAKKAKKTQTKPQIELPVELPENRSRIAFFKGIVDAFTLIHPPSRRRSAQQAIDGYWFKVGAVINKAVVAKTSEHGITPDPEEKLYKIRIIKSTESVSVEILDGNGSFATYTFGKNAPEVSDAKKLNAEIARRVKELNGKQEEDAERFSENWQYATSN